MKIYMTMKKLYLLLYQILIYLLLLFLPIFVYVVPYNKTLDNGSCSGTRDYFFDLFLKGKVYLFCILAISFLILAVITQVKKFQISTSTTLSILTSNKALKLLLRQKQRLCLETFFIFLYGILCILSYLFSNYKEIGLKGAMEQNETIMVLLGYCMIVYSFHILLQTYDLMPTICRALGMGCLFLILISLFQLFSHDLLQYSWVQTLVIPSNIRESVNEVILQSDVNAYNRVYGTLYNPNYFGVYGNLVFPILFYSVFHEKQRWLRLLFIIEIPLLFLLLLASGSKTFLLVFCIQVVLAMLSFLLRVKKYIIPAIFALFGFIVVFFGYNIFSDNSIGNRLKATLQITKTEPQLQNIQVQKEEILIQYGVKELHLSFSIGASGGIIQILDSEGEEYEFQIDVEGRYRFRDASLSSVYFYAGKMEETYLCIAMIEDIPWYFTYLEEEEEYAFLTPSGKRDTIEMAKTVFPGYERMASGRGYIWGRSIPLLKNNLWLGQGPETFILQFPHNDYVAAVNAGYYNTIIERPHSAYLQIGIQTGVLSLIMYVFSFLLYASRTIYHLWQKKTFQNQEWIQMTLLISLVGYMICMLAHDSLIVTAPIYWALLGCGIGLKKQIPYKS